MKLGSRIEERRKLLGMSQAELARRVGVRQSTMNSLINGESRSSRSIVRIAAELRTSPAYLTGEVDDPDDGAWLAPLLTSDEQALLESFARLDPVERKALLTIAHALAGRGEPDGLHARAPGYRPQPG